MKNRMKKIATCGAVLGLAFPLFAAENSSPSNQSQSSSSMSSSQSQNQNAPKECRLSKLLESNAKSRDGQNLGEVEDLLVNPQSGKINYVVLGKDSSLGTGNNRIPIPWQAVKVQPNGSLTINQDKARLQSAPSIQEDYSGLDQPAYTVTLYEFYAIPLSNAGGGESPGGAQQGSSSSSTNSSSSNQNL